MSERILHNRHSLTVYNRTISKCAGLKKLGAVVVKTPQEAIRFARGIIFTLSDIHAIEDVLSKAKNISYANKIFIQMGTISPLESVQLQKKIQKLGGEYFECPVLGSRKEAAMGQLILMVGSSKKIFDQWKGFLKIFGPKPLHIGPVGQAAALKLALNQLIASHAAGFSLSLGIVEKNGIDTNRFMAILNQSALFAPMFEKKLPSWSRRDYSNPNFPTKHLLKDVYLIIDLAKQQKLDTTVIKAIGSQFQRAARSGLAEKDYSSIYEIIHKK